jgi:NitT/TauT family transport system substrate-binding protein
MCEIFHKRAPREQADDTSGWSAVSADRPAARREGKDMRRHVGVLVASILFGSIITNGAVAEPLRLGLPWIWIGLGPFYIAQDKGFFAEEGIEVDLISMEEAEVLPALAEDRLDATVGTVDMLIRNLSEQRDYRYLFAIDDDQGGTGIVANKDIETVAGLKGKTVAYEEGSAGQFYLGVQLKAAGLSFADLKPTLMPWNDAGAAFVEGRVDAAATGAPWLTKAEESAHGHVLVDTSSSPGLIVDVVITTPAKLRARPDDLKALYRAWVKAVEFQKANEKEADEIMARGLGDWLADPAVAADARSAIAYYDDARNKAYMGTAAAPGAIVDTIASGLEFGRETGLFAPEVKPAELVAFEIVNQ